MVGGWVGGCVGGWVRGRAGGWQGRPAGAALARAAPPHPRAQPPAPRTPPPPLHTHTYTQTTPPCPALPLRPPHRGQLRDAEPDGLAVVVGGEPQVRLLDGALNGGDGGLVVGGDEQGGGVGGGDAGNLAQRRGGAVIVHLHPVQHAGVGAPSAHRGEAALQRVQRLGHPLPAVALHSLCLCRRVGRRRPRSRAHWRRSAPPRALLQPGRGGVAAAAAGKRAAAAGVRARSGVGGSGQPPRALAPLAPPRHPAHLPHASCTPRTAPSARGWRGAPTPSCRAPASAAQGHRAAAADAIACQGGGRRGTSGRERWRVSPSVAAVFPPQNPPKLPLFPPAPTPPDLCPPSSACMLLSPLRGMATMALRTAGTLRVSSARELYAAWRAGTDGGAGGG